MREAAAGQRKPSERRIAWGLAVLCLLAGPVRADEGADGTAAVLPDAVTETVEVRGRADELVGIADSATQGYVGAAQLQERPILRPGEILETVPGVIVSQHSGSGKANQYYLRGFNLDHGTDFRTVVDGVPVNMPSHGHGQGYTDVNFLIAELVSSAEYRKGPYDAHAGDFSAAGSVEISLARSLARAIVAVTGGSDFQRFLAADSVAVGGGSLLGALELQRSDGPWVLPENYRKNNGLLRWSRGGAAGSLALTAMAYRGSWDSTDQVPRRAVESGLIDRFGAIDASDGGSTHRYSLAANGRRVLENGFLRVSAYALHYDLSLYSNFTYALDDPENGDQFEQADRRLVTGFDVVREWTLPVPGRDGRIEAGLEARRDAIENGLYPTLRRQRLGVTRSDDITQWGFAPYAQLHAKPAEWLRGVLGVRADFYRAEVGSNIAENSGEASDSRVSPKLSLVFGPWAATELYANYGYGFHSNDARGATIRVDPKTGGPADRVPPLVRARGVDLGVRTLALRGLQSTLSVFRLDLDSELVFVGDAGATEAGRPSRRTGFEWANFYSPVNGLSFDLDVSVSKGRFTDDDPAGDHIPGAVERVLSAGVAVTNLGGFFGTARVRYFGPRALIEDASVRSESSTLVYATVGYTLRDGLRVRLDGFNLLDAEVSDIDYFYESRLPGEAEPVGDVHFHPAESRSVRLVVDWRF